MVYLSASENYFPSDIATHVANSRPLDGSGALLTGPSPLNPGNLDSLNAFANGGADVFLTSNEGIRALPGWFQGTRPASDGSIGSTRASVIVTVAKANNVLDAFYFYFYSYNQGNWVFDNPGLEFGDHVGDWEHTMVRFANGVPQSVYYSQHSGGQAFQYSAVEKHTDGVRPVAYVAKGSHANYAIPGPHDHTIPNFNTVIGPLTDHTDRGVFWDPALNPYSYTYDVGAKTFAAYNGADPVSFLNFAGKWGDKQLPDNTPGQINIFGQRKYTSGPTGPRDKKLDRSAVCPDSKNCWVRPILTPRDD